MALFSDGSPSTIDDLVGQDSFLFSVANVEGIDVSAKLSLACTELEIELTAVFGREASIYAPVLGQAPLDTDHLAVTPALKMWHSFKSLELVYRDAYFNQLNDRYKAKWAEYQNLSSWSRAKFIENGAGLVIDPLPQGGAPVVSFQPSLTTGGTVYVSMTYVNAAGEEGSPSTVMQIVIPDQQVVTIGCLSVATNVIGWNLYAGLAPTMLTRQNGTQLTLSAVAQMPWPPGESGPLVGTGQTANVTRDLPRRIMRG